jgi:membrane fusion protein, multidrug efflux system
VTPDQEAQVRGEAGDQSGRVSRVSPVVDPESRTFAVEILIDNKNGSLKPGAFGEGMIAIGVRENAALVPERAVSSFAGVHRVYSVSAGKAVEHQVILGVREDGLVEVVGDVDVDAVVISGLTGLAPGVEVRVRKAAAAKDDK